MEIKESIKKKFRNDVDDMVQTMNEKLYIRGDLKTHKGMSHWL